MSIYHAQTLLTVLDDHCILKSGRLLDKFCCIKFAARQKKKIRFGFNFVFHENS